VHGDHALEKTNRINMLFDFYGPLLTEKQRTFLKCHYHDDYSLGEIAADFAISRQAVYEHLKRAEQVLESYERKLGLLRRHERLQAGLRRLEEQIGRLPDEWRRELMDTVRLLRGAEGGADAAADTAVAETAGDGATDAAGEAASKVEARTAGTATPANERTAPPAARSTAEAAHGPLKTMKTKGGGGDGV
jgi:predicted DNA-binding protein YlxM (UPF0122 family)